MREASGDSWGVADEIFEGIVISENGEVIDANKSFAQMFGYELDELTGMKLLDFLLDGERELAVRRFSSGSEEVAEYQAVRKDGTVFGVEIRPRQVVRDGREVRLSLVLDVDERKQAATELRRQQDLYEGVLAAQSALGEGFVIVEGQRVVHANEGFCELSGYRPEEISAMSSFLDLVVEEERAPLMERRRRRMESGEGETCYDTALRSKDGHRIDVEVSFTTLETETGLRFLILVRDVTDGKLVQAKLSRQSELMELSHDAIIVRDLDDTITYWNRGASEMYGVSEEDAVDRVIHELLHTEFLSSKEAIDESLGKEGRWEGELLHRRQDGSPIRVESRQVRAREGNTATVLEINRDITERKTNENVQRFFAEASNVLVSSLDYRATLASVARLVVPYLADWCAVDVLEDDGTLERLAVAHEDPRKIELARELERRYPANPESPQGVPNVLRTGEPELVPELPASVLVEAAVDEEHYALLEKLAIRSYIIVPLIARGRKLGALTLVASESGRSYGAEDLKLAEDLARRAAFAIDNAKLYEESQREISERKKTESMLEAQAENLRRSNAELEQFAYVASHDLQEPLRMVSSYTQLLARRYKDQLDDDAGEFIGYAVDGANRMQQLINDLLVYSRVGTQGREFKPTECDAVFAAARDNLLVVLEETGAELVSGPLPTVMGDRSQLTRLLQNLIGNALKFRGQESPEVRIQAERREDKWVFSVRDNGIGIKQEYVDRIFVIFQRLHDRIQYPGTGIGLAVCKKIVERHGGRIWVESVLGEGSTFYFTLPALRG